MLEMSVLNIFFYSFRLWNRMMWLYCKYQFSRWFKHLTRWENGIRIYVQNNEKQCLNCNIFWSIFANLYHDLKRVCILIVKIFKLKVGVRCLYIHDRLHWDQQSIGAPLQIVARSATRSAAPENGRSATRSAALRLALRDT